MSLPNAWVERIFAKLTLTYGRDFLSRWEGQNMAAVMADWAHELRGYAQSPNAIKHALEILPADKPPTVLEFRALCRTAPQYAQPALPAPKLDKVQLALAIGSVVRPRGAKDPKAWAWRLRDIELTHGGVMPFDSSRPLPEPKRVMTGAQKQAWRETLRFELEIAGASSTDKDQLSEEQT